MNFYNVDPDQLGLQAQASQVVAMSGEGEIDKYT